MIGRFAAHFRYLVHLRNLVNLPYLKAINGIIIQKENNKAKKVLNTHEKYLTAINHYIKEET